MSKVICDKYLIEVNYIKILPNICFNKLCSREAIMHCTRYVRGTGMPAPLSIITKNLTSCECRPSAVILRLIEILGNHLFTCCYFCISILILEIKGKIKSKQKKVDSSKRLSFYGIVWALLI